MTYTDKKPTKPGWYFYREGDRQCVIRFGEDVGHGMFSEQGWGACIHINQFGGQFAGPIPEPGAHFIDRLKAAGVELRSNEESALRAEWAPDSSLAINPFTKHFQIIGKKIRATSVHPDGYPDWPEERKEAWRIANGVYAWEDGEKSGK
jgi:hypothetical protein